MIDRLIGLPRMIPSYALERKKGTKKVYVTEPWTMVNIGNLVKSSGWRAKWRKFFADATPEEEKEKVELILELWEKAGNDPQAMKAATAMYSAIKGAVLSDYEQKWESHSLKDSEEELQYLQENMYDPPEERKQMTREEFRSKMRGMEGLSNRSADRVFELACKYRKLFSPVKPLKMDRCDHHIELTSTRPVKINQYSFKTEADEEFVRTEVKRLTEEGFLERIVASPYQSPLTVVPKKGPDGQTEQR